MSRRAAVGTTVMVLIAIVVVGAVGAFVIISQAGTNPTTAQSSHTSSLTQTSVSTMVVATSTSPSLATTSSSATRAACYEGTLPTNSSSSTAQTSRVVFNVTQAFDSWNWTSLSTFTVGSYKFDLVGSQNSQTTFYLEPQVFINVTNSQGQIQKTDMTNLGSLNGNVWPPEMSGGPNVLFGGNATVQWLFPCNVHDVFLEVTTQ